MAKMTTEEAFVKVLQMHGIQHSFGIIGSAFMPISDLFPKAGITFWDVAHESNGNVYTDYNNGRILFPSASGTGLNISGTYSVKEVNTYISHDDDVEFLVHSDFSENGQDSPYFYNETGVLDQGSYFLPACFVSLASSENEEFSFGGEENTQSRVRVMVLTKDSYILDSVISRLRDTVREKITHIPYESFPYAYSYSVKDFPYTYTGVVGGQGSNPLCSYIDRVTSSKVVSEALREKLNKDFSMWTTF